MFPLKDSVSAEKPPLFTILLIGTNVICFLILTFVAGFNDLGAFLANYGVVPAAFLSEFGVKQASCLFTSMFLHNGILHLAGNMWFLWLFGDGVEDRFGKALYGLLYFGAGIIAGILQIVMYPHATLPLIGASGAISGVLGAYMILFPGATVSTLIVAPLLSRVVDVPARLFLGFWFIMQLIFAVSLLAGSSSEELAQIAFGAHIGGFLVGVLVARLVLLTDDLNSAQERDRPIGYF